MKMRLLKSKSDWISKTSINEKKKIISQLIILKKKNTKYKIQNVIIIYQHIHCQES